MASVGTGAAKTKSLGHRLKTFAKQTLDLEISSAFIMIEIMPMPPILHLQVTCGLVYKSRQKTIMSGSMDQPLISNPGRKMVSIGSFDAVQNSRYSPSGSFLEPNQFDSEKCTSISHEDGKWSSNSCDDSKGLACRFKASELYILSTYYQKLDLGYNVFF